LQTTVREYLSKHSTRTFTAEDIAQAIARPASTETVFKICQHLVANQELSADGRNGVRTKFRAV
jgi:hypothetical protein